MAVLLPLSRALNLNFSRPKRFFRAIRNGSTPQDARTEPSPFTGFSSPFLPRRSVKRCEIERRDFLKKNSSSIVIVRLNEIPRRTYAMEEVAGKGNCPVITFGVKFYLFINASFIFCYIHKIVYIGEHKTRSQVPLFFFYYIVLCFLPQVGVVRCFYVPGYLCKYRVLVREITRSYLNCRFSRGSMT